MYCVNTCLATFLNYTSLWHLCWPVYTSHEPCGGFCLENRSYHRPMFRVNFLNALGPPVFLRAVFCKDRLVVLDRLVVWVYFALCQSWQDCVFGAYSIEGPCVRVDYYFNMWTWRHDKDKCPDYRQTLQLTDHEPERRYLHQSVVLYACNVEMN